MSLDCLKMHPWRDRCLGKVQIYVHWSRFTWCNFRPMKAVCWRLCLHQQFCCRQQRGFEGNPVRILWACTTDAASSAPKVLCSPGLLVLQEDTWKYFLMLAQPSLAGCIKPPLWAVDKNKRQIICLVWDRDLRTRWIGRTMRQLRCRQWTLMSWVKRVNLCPTCTLLCTLCKRWGTSSRPCGAQEELWDSPVWQEGTWSSGEHELSISSVDPVYNSGTSLGQELLNWMQPGARKLFPVSSIIKDLPASVVSCQLHVCKTQRKDYPTVSKFATALYFQHKKRKIVKETVISLKTYRTYWHQQNLCHRRYIEPILYEHHHNIQNKILLFFSL